MSGIRITDVGDTAFNVEFGDVIDPIIHAKVMGLCHGIHRVRDNGGMVGLMEVVPTFRSLLISYDPLMTSRTALQAEAMALAEAGGEAPAVAGRHWRIPVCYDDDLGPDLQEVCRVCGLDRDALIALHSGAAFFVYMLGFMPGFAYMGGVPERLHLPRKASPRLKVPAGSVAIAESFGAVYPWDSPGGWHLLGRTPVVFFDLGRQSPALLAAGDHVAFQAIDRARYEAACRDPALVAPERLLAGGE